MNGTNTHTHTTECNAIFYEKLATCVVLFNLEKLGTVKRSNFSRNSSPVLGFLSVFSQPASQPTSQQQATINLQLATISIDIDGNRVHGAIDENSNSDHPTGSPNKYISLSLLGIVAYSYASFVCVAHRNAASAASMNESSTHDSNNNNNNNNWLDAVG